MLKMKMRVVSKISTDTSYLMSHTARIHKINYYNIMYTKNIDKRQRSIISQKRKVLVKLTITLL